MKVLSI